MVGYYSNPWDSKEVGFFISSPINLLTDRSRFPAVSISPLDTSHLSSLILSAASFRCNHFVRFEGAVTLIGLSTTALMMMIR